MSRFRDVLQPAGLLVAMLATVPAADAKPPRGKHAVSTVVARSEIEPAEGGYIIVTAPRMAKTPPPAATLPVGATIRIDKSAVTGPVQPDRSAAR